MCKENPTIKELAEILGSSHQNVKQILLKLEQKGFVELYVDEHDKRKQRITLTQHCIDFCEKNNEMSMRIMEKLFEGLSEEQLQATIVQIENNMKQL